jgi:hypothetical protein
MSDLGPAAEPSVPAAVAAQPLQPVSASTGVRRGAFARFVANFLGFFRRRPAGGPDGPAEGVPESV